MIIKRKQVEKSEKETRYARMAFRISLVALSYPLFLFLLAGIWSALTSKDLSKKAQATVTLMIFPVILSCALAFVLSLRGRDWRRPTTIACSLSAAVLNLLAFLAISISY